MVNPIGKPIWLFDDEAEMCDFVARNGGEPEDIKHNLGVCYGFTDDDGAYRITVGVFNGSLSTAVHECIHGAWEMLKMCSIRSDYNNQEMLCYLSGWLLSEFVKAFPEIK